MDQAYTFNFIVIAIIIATTISSSNLTVTKDLVNHPIILIFCFMTKILKMLYLELNMDSLINLY